MNKRNVGIIALLVSVLSWMFFLIFIPTFDFDESLYRRVAETMKATQNPWLLTWDHWPLYHKPPFLYWLIWLSSRLFDADPAHISAFAARFPSFICSLGILLGLAWAPGYIERGVKSRSWSMTPPLLFLMCLFPMMTATAVLFEPIQTLLLMPTLLIVTRLFAQDGRLNRGEWIFLGVSLFAATAVKGLNGLVIPCFALGVHTLLQWKRWRTKKTLKLSVCALIFALLPAFALLGITFYGLDQMIGRPFTEEFVWIQHFQRSQIPMESHSGNFLYHPTVIWIGSGLFIPFFLSRVRLTRANFLHYGFPFTYALSFIFIFSLSATKLPHYMWPAWPALALGASMLISRVPTPRFSILMALSSIPMVALAIAGFIFSVAPAAIFTMIPQSPMVRSIVEHFPGLPIIERLSLIFAFLSCTLFFALGKKRPSLETSALTASLFTFFLTVGLTPIAKRLMIDPYEAIVESLKQRNPTPSDCIRSSGASSATLSLALGNELLHNRCEPNTLRFLITPEWKENECAERNLSVVDRKSYMVLCEKRK